MFGKSLIKLIGFAVAGALALAGGAQILTSAITIVIALRTGNLLPFIFVAGITVLILRLPQTLKDESPFRFLQMVLMYAMTAYFVVVVFVALLPFGILASFTGCSMAAILCSVIHDPSEVRRYISGMNSEISLTSSSKIGSSIIPGEIAESSALKTNQVLLIPLGQENQVVSVMRDRPLLPVSLTRYEDFSALFVLAPNNSTLMKQVKNLLVDAGVEVTSRVPPLLLEVILKMPLIDQEFGHSMEDFCYVSDSATVDLLLEKWSARMTVFPTIAGPWMIVPTSSVPGIKTGSIPMGHEYETLLLHDFSSIWESADKSATATG